MIKAQPGKLKAVKYFWQGDVMYERQNEHDSARAYLNDTGDIVVIRNRLVVRAFNGEHITSLVFVDEEITE